MLLQHEPAYFKQVWWSLSLFILALFTRLLYLDANPLSLDEPFSVYFSQMSFAEMIQQLSTENNPPFFYFLLHLWMNLFGNLEFSVRFLPAFFSALIVPMAFKFGQAFFSWRVGLMASILFLFSESQIEFAHDCRAYSLLLVLTLMLFYLTMRMHQIEIKKKQWMLFITINVALLYTHFIGWIVVFFVFLFVLTSTKPERRRNYLIAYATVLTLLLPYLTVFYERFNSSINQPGWQSVPNVLELYNRFVSFFNKPLVAVCCLILLVLGFILPLLTRKQISIAIQFLLFAFVFLYFGIFLISFRFPMFMERYLLICSIPIYFLLAYSLEQIWMARSQAAWLFLLIAGLMFFSNNFNPTRNKPSNKIANLLIRLKKDKQSAVIINPEWYESTFLYYHDLKLFQDYHLAKQDLAKRGIFSINELNTQWIQNQMKNYPKIVYFQSNPDLVDAANENLRLLSQTHQKLSAFEAYDCKFTILSARANGK